MPQIHVIDNNHDDSQSLVALRIFNLYSIIPFWIPIIPSFYTFITGYGCVQGNVRRILGLPLVSNLIFIRNSNIASILIGFNFLYLILAFSETKIVDHISANHKMAWCCLQFSVICTSDSPCRLIKDVIKWLIFFFFWTFMITFQVK
jgi:hypothetical protein